MKLEKDEVLKGYKIRLKPTEEQIILFKKSAGSSRFIYNWGLQKQIDNYKETGKIVSDLIIRKEMTQLKKQKDFEWLNDVGSNVLKQSLKNLFKAYSNFFKGKGFPKFKTKKSNKESFYVNYESLKKTNNGFRGERLGEVKTSEPLPEIKENEHYYCPYISFDNKYWYLCFSIKVKKEKVEKTEEIIGIDLGIKDFAVLSNGKVYKNINKTAKVKKLKKKLKRLQKKLSKKYVLNKCTKNKKTKNSLKLEQKINLIYRKLRNIRLNYLHQITSEIVKTKPSKIVIEDLKVKDLLKNKHLSEKISEQNFYKFREILTYKCDFKEIDLVIADKFYPSSKTCSCCGHIKQDLKLKDRVFKCPTCGFEIDRDLNAAINLKMYEKQK